MKKNTPFWVVVAIAIFMFGTVCGVAFVENAANDFDFLRDIPALEDCVGAKVGTEDLAVLSARLTYCYDAIYLQSELNEFTIRRLVFQSQHSSDMVLLWMVVFITVGGVLLSGLQLYTSYRITADGKDGVGDGAVPQSSIEVERGKIALRSSVTGLFILLISFAFFYVFVIFVYKIEDPSRNGGGPETANFSTPPVLEEGNGAFVGEGSFSPSAGSLMPPPVIEDDSPTR